MTIAIHRYSYYIIAGLLAVVFSDTHLQAQNEYKFNVRFNAGPALAFGQLGSQRYNTGGYALSGLSAAAEGTWYFYPEFGIGIAYSATSFPFADGAYAHDKVNNDAFMQTLFLKSDPYKVRTLTTGAYYHKHITGKFSATGKLAGGIMWARTPDQLYAASYFTIPSFAYKVTSSRSTKATFQPGLACNFQLFEQVALSLNADYTIAVPAFGFRTANDSYVSKITFSYLNTMIGIDFRF